MNTTPARSHAGPTPAPAFAYTSLPASARDHLRAAAEQARSLAYRTACDMIRVGRLLADARRRVKRRTFALWLAAELPWSRAHSYRLMGVADVFGPLIEPAAGERIEPTALYLLARDGVPPEARRYAVGLSGERVVSAADAREILAAHRPAPELTRAELKAHDERMKSVRKAEADADRAAARAAAQVPPAAAWAAFADLVAAASVVHVATIAEGGEDADDVTLFSVTVHREDDRPRNAVRRSLEDAVLAAAGMEPEKTCPSCGETKPVGEFGDNADLPDGRNRYCKVCERKRSAEGKRRKKAADPAG